MKKELKKRIITSFILIAIALNCLFINNFSWLFLLAIVSFICWFEFINLIKKIWKTKVIIILPIILSFLFLCLFIYTAYSYRIEEGAIGILFVLGICIFSDIGGYTIGKSIGGKKLTKISPNKTISGSIGSFCFALIPIIYFFYYDTIYDYKPNYWELISFVLIVSLICQAGDIFISYFKRKANVKDTGTLLPGHGGLLDRIDGVMFAIPGAFLLDKIIF